MRKTSRLLLIGGAAAALAAVATLLIVAREACKESGQGFDWVTWHCTGAPPPILLQRDLQRT